MTLRLILLLLLVCSTTILSYDHSKPGWIHKSEPLKIVATGFTGQTTLLSVNSSIKAVKKKYDEQLHKCYVSKPVSPQSNLL